MKKKRLERKRRKIPEKEIIKESKDLEKPGSGRV